MSKESDKKEIYRILHRMVASPFRAILGDGGGTVNVAGKAGYVWARKLGQEGTVFQAYNRGTSATNEGRVVLVQESRVEGLPGYEIIGSAGGDYVDLSGHVATEPFDAHLGNSACRVYNNADQVIGTGAWTVLTLNSERYDTDGIHDTVTNNSRLTCKTVGIYAICANGVFAANATGSRYVGIRLNGATYIGRTGGGANATAGHGTDLMVATQYQFAVNDYVEMMVYQNSGGNLNSTAYGNICPEFMMARIG